MHNFTISINFYTTHFLTVFSMAAKWSCTHKT